MDSSASQNTDSTNTCVASSVRGGSRTEVGAQVEPNESVLASDDEAFHIVGDIGCDGLHDEHGDDNQSCQFVARVSTCSQPMDNGTGCTDDLRDDPMEGTVVLGQSR